MTGKKGFLGKEQNVTRMGEITGGSRADRVIPTQSKLKQKVELRLEGEGRSEGSFLPGRALPWGKMVPPSCRNQALWTQCLAGTPSREWPQTTAHMHVGMKASLPLSDIQVCGSILCLQNIPKY